MALSTFTRFSGGNRERLHTLAKQARPILEAAGASMVRIVQIHTGHHTGDLLARVTYPSWETFGSAQQSLAENQAYQEIMAEAGACMVDRSVVVNIEL